MANDAITMTGIFDKFGASAQKTCWTLAKSKIAESARCAGDEPVNRAILFFGGANPEENHSRYYDNLRDMIQGLKEKGVKSENIIVMHADGLDPAPDQSVNPGYIVNSEMDFLRNEGIAVIPAYLRSHRRRQEDHFPPAGSQPWSAPRRAGFLPQ